MKRFRNYKYEYNVLTLSEEKWRTVLEQVFIPVVHVYFENLFKESSKIARAKTVTEAEKLRYAISIFQDYCINVINWSLKELKEQIEILKRKYPNLKNLIKTVLQINLAILSLTRCGNLDVVKFPHISTGKFVHRVFSQVSIFAKNYPYLFIPDKNFLVVQKNHQRIREEIKNILQVVILKTLPVGDLNANISKKQAKKIKKQVLKKKKKSQNKKKRNIKVYESSSEIDEQEDDYSEEEEDIDQKEEEEKEETTENEEEEEEETNEEENDEDEDEDENDSEEEEEDEDEREKEDNKERRTEKEMKSVLSNGKKKIKKSKKEKNKIRRKSKQKERRSYQIYSKKENANEKIESIVTNPSDVKKFTLPTDKVLMKSDKFESIIPSSKSIIAKAVKDEKIKGASLFLNGYGKSVNKEIEGLKTKTRNEENENENDGNRNENENQIYLSVKKSSDNKEKKKNKLLPLPLPLPPLPPSPSPSPSPPSSSLHKKNKRKKKKHQNNFYHKRLEDKETSKKYSSFETPSYLIGEKENPFRIIEKSDDIIRSKTIEKEKKTPSPPNRSIVQKEQEEGMSRTPSPSSFFIHNNDSESPGRRSSSPSTIVKINADGVTENYNEVQEKLKSEIEGLEEKYAEIVHSSSPSTSGSTFSDHLSP